MYRFIADATKQIQYIDLRVLLFIQFESSSNCFDWTCIIAAIFRTPSSNSWLKCPSRLTRKQTLAPCVQWSFKWATTWQNQQNECAPSEDLDQPGQIRVFAVRSMDSYGPKVSSCGQRRLIRLGGCPGSSESSLGEKLILFVLSYRGSNTLA